MHRTKIALIIEYDGSRYHGFQLQPQSPTVQEVLEEAIKGLTGRDSRVACASRTDAGVHARAQVASFRTEASLPVETYIRGLNHFLPEDVRVQAAYQLPEEYDVRTRATSRLYRYVVLNRRTESPLLRARAHWVPFPLDLERMNLAAGMLLGTRDFGPFCGATLRKGASTVRELTRAEFRRDGEVVIFEVEGSSFLPQQVRRMAGALLDVGLGKSTIEEFEGLVNCQKRGCAGPTLPPQGLFLEAVRYREFPPESGGENK